MKTKLPEAITTVEEAKAFITDLFNNGEGYHPEDDAFDVIWTSSNPTIVEKMQLNKLMADIYDLPGNEDYRNMVFDPCGLFCDLSNPNWRDE